MNELKFKCFDKDFKYIDSFFAIQEMTEKPIFTTVILSTETTEYRYEVENINSYYYIVTS